MIEVGITKKRFLVNVIVVYILTFVGSAGLQYYKSHTIHWVDHLVYAFFFVGFLMLFSYLMGDITFKKKDDMK